MFLLLAFGVELDLKAVGQRLGSEGDLLGDRLVDVDDELDYVGRVVVQLAHKRAVDHLAEALVQRHLVLDHGEYEIHVGLRDPVVDLAYRRIVLLEAMRVASTGRVQVTRAVIRLHDASQLAVAGVVEAGVSGEDDEFARRWAPADFLLLKCTDITFVIMVRQSSFC